MFRGCENLTSINLSNIDMVSAKNMNYMFSNCEKLKLIIFPKNEKVNNVKTMVSTFANCHQ